MRAVVYHGHEDMRLEQVPDAALQHDQDIVLRVERAAICGSDLHLWHATAFPENGFTVGHEFLGTVEEVGRGVSSLRRGDRVLVACTIGCGACASCRRGSMSGCPVTTDGGTRAGVFGFSRALPGGQAEAVRVPFADTNCFKLPPELDDDQCLFLTDILPTGYLGTELAEVAPGDTVVVFGCGPVGTFAQRCAQVRGAARVIAVDLDDGRLERARARGCIPVQPQRENLLELVRDLTGGQGADSAIEAVGVPDLVHQAAAVVRHGGRVAVIGVILAPYEIQWPLFFSKNLTLRTALVNPQVFIPTLLPLIETGKLDPREIITHRFALDQAPLAYQIFAGHQQNVLKVVLTP